MIKRKTMVLFPHEVFESLEQSKNKQERIEILRNGSSLALKLILQCAFDDSVILDLPTGAPPYKQDTGPLGLQQTPLKQAIQILPRLTKSNTRIDNFRKEKLFIQLIENVYPKDALIILAAKDKKLHKTYPLVTKSLVREAFPDLNL
jgi:hypothetical protein